MDWVGGERSLTQVRDDSEKLLWGVGKQWTVGNGQSAVGEGKKSCAPKGAWEGSGVFEFFQFGFELIKFVLHGTKVAQHGFVLELLAHGLRRVSAEGDAGLKKGL